MKPLKVLSISTLFPSPERPRFGSFVAKQAMALSERNDVEMIMVNPVPARLTSVGEVFDSLSEPIIYFHVNDGWGRVTRPTFFRVPLIGSRWTPAAIAKVVLPLGRPIIDHPFLDPTEPFDVIDAQFFFPDGPAAAIIAKELGVPLSIKARGSDIHQWGQVEYARSQMLAAAEQAAGLLAVSEALKADMVALGMPAEKISVHYTGIDHAKFRPVRRIDARAGLSFDLPAEASLLASVGNLIPLKGHALAIEALRELPDVHLAIAGLGPERDRLCRLASKLGLADRIHMLGSIGSDAIAGLLAAADAMVLPSEREGLANAWIEALACGTPLVITNVGGAREVVTSPSAGRLVERNPSAIAAAVRDILTNPPSQAEVAANAARFSWETNAAQLAAHYRLVAG